MPRTVVVRVARRPAFAVCGALFLFWFGLACRLYLCLSLCRVRYSLLFFCVVSCSDFFCPNQQPMMSIDHFFGFALQTKKKKERNSLVSDELLVLLASLGHAVTTSQADPSIHPCIHPSLSCRSPQTTRSSPPPVLSPLSPLPSPHLPSLSTSPLFPPPLSFHLPTYHPLSNLPPPPLFPTTLAGDEDQCDWDGVCLAGLAVHAVHDLTCACLRGAAKRPAQHPNTNPAGRLRRAG